MVFGLGWSTSAQEELSELHSNPALHEGPSPWRASGDTLNLPFLEDFNEDALYPLEDLWMDSYVFVNRNMAIDPPTIGTATFDGLNEFGLPYDILTPNAWGPADMLTSNPINLNYDPVDSVFISFWYQAEGLGNAPELEDSLILEFFSPITGWKRAWSVVGQDGGAFKQVILPITDTLFLKRGFQFRFRNYASLAGNLDHWHIDYIYLDDLRSSTDSLIDDIGITHNTLPLTQYYSNIPWSHFLSLSSTTDWVIDQQKLFFRNFSSGTRNVNFGHELYQDGSLNFASPVFFKNSAPNAPDSVNMLYDFSGVADNSQDSSDILIKYFIKTLPDVEPENDTLFYHQFFHNYYAFDDGTAERGYSLNAIQAKMAVKYYPLQGDSLRGIQLFFPPVLVEAPLNSFKIGVWSYDNGIPGTPLWKSDSLYKPVYSVWNEFVRYTIPPIYLSDTVFIGIEQLTASRLYVGFDRNLKNEDKIFYNLDGNWYGSNIEGSLMLRPMFGAEVQSNVGLEEFEELDLTLYPNPAHTRVYLQGTAEGLSYVLLDMYGRELSSGIYNNGIDVGAFAPGMYLLRLVQGEVQKTIQFLVH
jgi:hypothetical protein